MAKTDPRAAGLGFLLLALPAATLILFCFEPQGETATGSIVWRILPGMAQLTNILGLVVGFALVHLFQRRFWPSGEGESRSLRSSGVLVIVQALLLRGARDLGMVTSWEMPLPLEWAWLRYPWFFVPALGVVLLGWRYGVLLSLSGVWMFLMFTHVETIELVAAVLGSAAAVLWLRRSTTRGRVLRAGLWSGALVALCALIRAGLAGTADPVRLLVIVGIPLGIGFGCAILLLALLPFVEWVLGELSDVSLTEYGTDHRLLDALRDQAPGTWNHTLNVADLARQAASAIGARALFCHTAALFHDIGKLKRPELFAENIVGPSPHDTLDPRESARLIIEHVGHGLELARKHRLPRPFRIIIAEHHGTSLVRFFHARALQTLVGRGETFTEADFRYPGPPPSTKESGIIALADSVEAATRSMGEFSPQAVRDAVVHLIADRVADGEYCACPLTLSELARIEASFQAWLAARNHKRPAYSKTESGVESVPRMTQEPGPESAMPQGGP